jgi:hypothetical protein
MPRNGSKTVRRIRLLPCVAAFDGAPTVVLACVLADIADLLPHAEIYQRLTLNVAVLGGTGIPAVALII